MLKNAGISWSKKLIDKYYDIVEKPYKWERENWEISIYRDTTPTKFLSPFWSSICYSNKIDWTESFMEEFQEILNFKNVLSLRNDLPWTIDLLEKFEDKWDWNLLSFNKTNLYPIILGFIFLLIAILFASRLVLVLCLFAAGFLFEFKSDNAFLNSILVAVIPGILFIITMQNIYYLLMCFIPPIAGCFIAATYRRR